MNRRELVENIKRKKSFLCVGLDTDIEKIPDFLKHTQDPVFAFNKAIIDATKDYCVSYKLNLAFYEKEGARGWDSLQKTLEVIPGDQFVIADAKRGDIGNTARMYARTFFETYDFNAVTIAPYMGGDSVKPFLENENKWAIILGLTSNAGANDFQLQQLQDGTPVWEKVVTTSAKWGNAGNTMFVIGATRNDQMQRVRELLPDHFLLVPGVGAQGGKVEDLKPLMNKDIGILVNSSRSIIYAGSGKDFDTAAAEVARTLQQSMKPFV